MKQHLEGKSKAASSKKLSGIWPVLVTPYHDNLRIDLDAYREMIRWLMQFEIGGIYANCQSSEMTELSNEERLLLIEEAIKTVDGKVPVAVTGNFGKNIEEHIRFVNKAAQFGPDSVMLTVPTFLEDDKALEAYYLQIADQTQVPLGIYECPVPRSYHLGLDLISTLANTGRFVAFKETSCEIEKIKQVIAITQHTPLALLQANVPYLVDALQAGAEGSMNIVANWLPDLTTEVAKKSLAHAPQTRELHDTLCAMEMVQRSVHPTGVKYLMAKRGVPIKPLTRYKRKLTSEEAYSLDATARLYFETDGSLSFLKKFQPTYK